MKVLVIGLGSIGRRHGRNFAELGHDVAGFDLKRESREWFERDIGSTITFDSIDGAIADGADIAVIASPNCFHLEQSLLCAQAGMHLLVEKPMSTTADGLDELAAVVRSKQLICMLGSNWKFHPGLMRLKQIIDSGELGQIVAVQSIGGQYLPDWHPWEDYRQMYSSRSDLSGGVLLDCHDIDYLTWLMGPIKSVNCRMINTNTLEISTSDLAAISMEFESGALGSAQIDYLQRPNARRVHISGSQGTAIWDFSEQHVRSFNAESDKWSEYKLATTYDLNQMYVDELNDFISCIEEGRMPKTPIDQAMHVMAVFDAISSSAANDGAISEVTA